jgi:threonine/homoserine/homoserine lactone efflux protein
VITANDLALFALAALVLAITPGPNMLYLVSRTLCQGRAAGIVSLAGTTLGFFFHALAAAFGLTAVLLAVPLAFEFLKYAGAAYLAWLAWSALKPGGVALFAPVELPPEPKGKLFHMGLITSILNPKVALFYVALFPQFVDPGRGSVLLQSLILAAVQIVIVAVSDFCMVLTASRVAGFLARRPQWAAAQRWLLGLTFGALAVRLALTERK